MGAMTLNELAAEANSIAVDDGIRSTLLDLAVHINEGASTLLAYAEAEADHVLLPGSELVLHEHVTVMLLSMLYLSSLLGIDIEAAVMARLAEAKAKGLD